jgi:hypothetical protein
MGRSLAAVHEFVVMHLLNDSSVGYTVAACAIFSAVCMHLQSGSL